MSALPWPVDTITEAQARSWFEAGPNVQFTGSWRLNNKYTPKLTAIRHTDTQWAFRFKRFKRASLGPRGEVRQQKPEYTFTTSYKTAEEAEPRCYRDIYAKMHAHVALFRPPDVAKRKAAMSHRDSRARKRESRRDPEAAAKHLHEKRMQEVRLELSRRATLRPRSLQTEVQKRPACSQQAGAQAKRVRTSAKPQMSRKQLAHQKKIRKLSKEANKNIDFATEQLQAIKEAYEKAENAMHEEYSQPKSKRSATSPQVLQEEKIGEDQRSMEQMRKWNCDIESGIMLSTLSEGCMKNLIMQMKSVYRYYVCAKTLWQQRLKFVEALKIGQAPGRKPRQATVVQEVLKTQWKDTSAMSKEKFPCHVTIVKYVRRWENNKSFHIANFARKNQSW